MPTTQLYRLVYVSRAVELLTEEQLSALLQQVRARNQSASITGLLLYKDLSFIQVLEGSRSSIDAVYSSISKDPRHFRVKILIDMEPINERSFPEWSMGFQRLDQQFDSKQVGFSNFLETELPLVLAGRDDAKQTLNKLFSYFRSHS